MSDKKPGLVSYSPERRDIVEAVLAAPFDLILGGMFGVGTAVAARLYFTGFTFLGGGLAAILLIIAVVRWFVGVLDRGTDRIADNMLKEIAAERGQRTELTQEERDLGELHWALRYTFWIAAAVCCCAALIVNPLTVLGIV